MRVAGESENYGTEQEHLNNVFGARLRITALRGASGPGIELLEYLAPRDGRPFPPDEHANDLVHRQTMLVTQDADAAARQLGSAKIQFVSSGVVANHNGQLGFSKAFWSATPMATRLKSSRNREDNPMPGIIRTAVNSDVSLELDYREPSTAERRSDLGDGR